MPPDYPAHDPPSPPLLLAPYIFMIAIALTTISSISSVLTPQSAVSSVASSKNPPHTGLSPAIGSFLSSSNTQLFRHMPSYFHFTRPVRLMKACPVWSQPSDLSTIVLPRTSKGAFLRPRKLMLPTAADSDSTLVCRPKVRMAVY